MYVNVLMACMSVQLDTVYVPSAHRGQKTMLGALEMEL